MTSSFRNSPPLPWNWNYLSSNPSITMRDVLENPDKPWNWRQISANPSITLSDIFKNKEKAWDWKAISRYSRLKESVKECKGEDCETVVNKKGIDTAPILIGGLALLIGFLIGSK